MLKYMLDTNIAIYVIKQRPREALEQFNRHGQFLCISAVSQAELIHGAEKSDFVERNLRTVNDFCSRLMVITYGKNAAMHYGQIRANLERRGETIGVNDLHIAGHARSEGLTLITNNRREFDRIDGLQVDNWV